MTSVKLRDVCLARSVGPEGRVLGLLCCLLWPAWLSAQALPDAGALRQQIEQQREQPMPNVQRPAKVSPPEAQPKEGMSVSVKTFKLAGNSLLSTAQLLPQLGEFLNRPLGFEGLQLAADAVAAAYREAGWLVRVYLPEQDVSEGEVSLQVVEASFAGVRVDGEPSQRVPQKLLESYFLSDQAVGAPLNANRLDRALLLVDDLPGISVSGALAAGEQEGQTALVLQTTDEALVYGDVSLDNTGSVSTGKRRLSANLSVNSPFSGGDLFSLNALRTHGSRYGRVAYTFPLGQDGLRLGLNASDMRYEVIAGDNVSADVKGSSGSKSLDLNYPWMRSRQLNVYLSAGIDDKSFFNEAGGKVPSDYASRSARFGVSGNWFDGWGGGGANSASLQLIDGHLFKMAAHTALKTIDRDFSKLNYSLSRQQSINNEHSLFFMLSGQQASQLLDSSERFYVGGPSSVRAYPSSEHGGDRGHLLSLEWRWRLDTQWVFTAFTDQGRVRQLIDKVNPGDGEALSLRGRGLSVSWAGPQGISTKLTWSHRIGNNPKPYQNISDSDGTLVKNRIWWTVGMPF